MKIKISILVRKVLKYYSINLESLFLYVEKSTNCLIDKIKIKPR